MARIRSIKPKFWDDTKIGRISRDARLLYIGMWNFADDIGVVIGDSIWLKSKIFPYDQIQIQQFEKWMNELVINGFICLLSYRGERFIYLPTFTRHQVINKPNHDDLNIPKNLIDSIKETIPEQSRNNPVSFTEQSVLIIGEGNGNGDIPPIVPPDECHEDEQIDYRRLMDTFNRMFSGKLPKVSSMTENRKKAVKARASENGKSSIMKVFENVLRSPFLLGNNDRNWRCDFDWIFRPTNFLKILEGNYENRTESAGRGTAAGRIKEIAGAILRGAASEDVP